MKSYWRTSIAAIIGGTSPFGKVRSRRGPRRRRRGHRPRGRRAAALAGSAASGPSNTTRSRVHRDDAGDERLDRPELVEHDHDRRAGVGEDAQRVGERRLARRVDAGERLVEDQHPRAARQPAGHQGAPLLAPGQPVDRPTRRWSARPTTSIAASTARRSALRERRHHPFDASRPERTSSSTVTGIGPAAVCRCGT